jgi:hypothetical protein
MGQSLCNIAKRHVGNKLQLYQELYNPKMQEGTSMQVHIDKLRMIVNQEANINHKVYAENLAFTL